MLSREGPDAARSRAEAARVLGAIAAGSPLQGELARLLRDEDRTVVEQALLAAGKTRNTEVLALVVERLADPHLLGAARAALVQYSDGAAGMLEEYLNDEHRPLAVRKQIPGVLARLGTAQAASILSSSMIHSDAGLRFDVIKALNRLRKEDPSLLPPNEEISDMLEAEAMGFYRSFQILAVFDPASFGAPASQPDAGEANVLTRALRERMEHEVERLFRLLALPTPWKFLNTFCGPSTTGCSPALSIPILA
jgi:hypothetical protein